MASFVTCLAIGDVHFKESNVRDTDLMCKALLEIVKAKQPDFIVMLGDTLDRHETIHVTPLTRAVTFLSDLCFLAPVYLLIGNHDLINNSQFLSNQHPFNALKKWSNLIVVDKVVKCAIKNHVFTFVPYVPPGRFAAALGTLSEDKVERKETAIFCHQEFRGAKMGPILSTTGDVWPADASMIISGHIHDYDRLADNILYTGTPIQHGFGDTVRKTVSLLTFAADMKEERIDLNIPRKIVIHLNVADVNDYEIKEGNSEVKVIISGISSALSAIMKSVKVQSWIKSGVKVVYRHIAETIVGATLPAIAKAKYATILYQMCAKDNSLKDLYEEIIGKSVINGNKPRLLLKKMKF